MRKISQDNLSGYEFEPSLVLNRGGSNSQLYIEAFPFVRRAALVLLAVSRESPPQNIAVPYCTVCSKTLVCQTDCCDRLTGWIHA